MTSRGVGALLDDPFVTAILGVSAGVAGLSFSVSASRHEWWYRWPDSWGTASTSRLISVEFLTAALLLTAAAVLIHRVVHMVWRRRKALAHLPGPRCRYLGPIWALTSRDPHRLVGDWAEKYGPVYKVRIFLFHVVVVTDPLLAMHVLHSPLFDKWAFVYAFLDPLLNGPSILTGPTDEHWKTVRKGVAPAFSTQHMKEALQPVIQRSKELGDFLLSHGKQAEHNMDKLLLREAMDVIGDFGFQMELNALRDLTDPPVATKPGESAIDVLLGATHEVEKRFGGPQRSLMLWNRDLWHGAWLIRRYNEQINNMLQHIKKKEAALREGSFAKLLLKTKDHKTGKQLTDSKMAPEIAALFFAGIDTTGHTNTWLLYMLTQHPEVEARIVKELDALELLTTPERPNPRQLVFDDLKQLNYLQCVIKEVLRMYPPVGIGQIRMATQDVTLGEKIFIPKGVITVVPHYGIHNVSHNYDNPTRFDPERWMEPGAEYAQKLPLGKEWYEGLTGGGLGSDPEADASDIGGASRRPKRYFPFAIGPRDCVGQSLAKVSLAATMATLLQRFTFRLADQMGGAEGVRKREQYTLITGIADGMWMHAIPRAGVKLPKG